MTSNATILRTTGIREEVQQIIWRIENWIAVQQNEQLVAQQKIEFKIQRPPLPRSKWLLGLRVNTQCTAIMFYCKLLETVGCDVTVPITVNVAVCIPDGSTELERSCQNSFRQNDEIEQEWSVFNAIPVVWRRIVDVNGALTISIKMAVMTTSGNLEVKSYTNAAMEEFKKKSVERLQSNQAALLENSSSADVKFVCSDGNELTAHRIVLKAQCPVFESMLRADNFTEGQTGVISVADISGKTMAILLHYIYTGELKTGWSDADTISEITYAAGKYQLTEMLNLLDKIIGTDEVSVCSISLLSLVQKLGLKKAEAQLMDKIVKLTNAAKCSDDLIAIYGSTE